MSVPVLRAAINVLAHVPDLVLHGSKPAREIAHEPTVEKQVRAALRSYSGAVAYAPHQVYLGAHKPEELSVVSSPWWAHPFPTATRETRDGEILPQEELYALLKVADQADLVLLRTDFIATVRGLLGSHRLTTDSDLAALGEGVGSSIIEEALVKRRALRLVSADQTVGCILPAHNEDPALQPPILLENLACKATAAWALRRLLRDQPGQSVDYVLSASEEAVGDRYQRGGGNLAKAIAEMAGLRGSVAFDVKAFCAGPLHACVIAAALVQSNLARTVAVVAGGSVPKLGMKFRGHLAHGYPVLEDVLAAVAFLVGSDDRRSPIIRTEAIGRCPVGLPNAQQALIEALAVRPLEEMGLRLTDVSKFAPELHNPEITVPANSGDVPRSNYRMIAAVAALRGEIPRDGMDKFIAQHGMPGFSPTQGHVASAVCYLPHALDGLRAGTLARVLLLARGSLFLGRMTTTSDGVSVLLEGQS